MKKNIKIIVTLFITIIIVSLCVSIYQKTESKKIAAEKIAALPDFSFKSISGIIFSDSNLRNPHGKIIINYFNPECEHCQYMAQQFVKIADKLKDLTLLMITISDSLSIAKFKIDYHLDSIPNIILLRDTKFQFAKIFGTTVVPSFFIYTDKKLVKEIIGETKIENLIN